MFVELIGDQTTAGDLLTYKVVGNFPSSPQKFPYSPNYLPHQYFALLDVIYNNNNNLTFEIYY